MESERTPIIFLVTIKKHIAFLFVFLFLYCPLSVNAIVTLQIEPSDSLEIARLTKAAANFLKSSNYDGATKAVDTIFMIAEKAGLEHKKADCYFNYSLIDRKQGNLPGFFENATKAIDIYMRHGLLPEAAKVFTGIAQVYVEQNDYSSAHEYFSKSLELRERGNDSLGILNNLINIGNLFHLQGNHDEASAFFYRALRLADAIGNKNLQAIALMNVSNVLITQKQYQKALEYLQTALALHKLENNMKEVANVLHNIGIIWFEIGDHEKATEYYLQALELKEKLKSDLPGLIKIYNNLGLLAKEKGDLEKATEFYLSTLETARKINDRHAEAVALNNLGSLFLVQHKSEALHYINQSLEIAGTLGLRKLVLSNYDNLKQYYKQKGDYENALYFASKYLELNDSIYYEESAAKIIEMQTLYDTEVKEKENHLLLAENSMRRQSQRFLLIAIIILILLSLSLLWAFVLKRKSLLQSRELHSKENELSQIKLKAIEAQNMHLRELLFAEEEIKRLQAKTLEQKKQELTSATMLIANKNEVFERLKKIAIEIKKDGSDHGNSISKSKEIIAEIDRQNDLNNQWEQFKIHFESIHKGFFNDLREKGVCLTQNDLQICAYIKLNLSTKEISRLMNIAPESVNTHRYRLRKKFKLPADKTLDELIHGI